MEHPPRGWRRVAWRELRMMRSSLQVHLLTWVLPLAAAALLAVLFGASVPRDLPVVIVDQDHSPLSRRATRMVDAVAGLRVAYQEASPEEGLRRVRKGEAYALVLFPRHLEREVVKGSSPVVGLYVNYQFLLPGSLVYRDLRQALGTLSMGIKIRVRKATGEGPRPAGERCDPVRLEAHALFNPELDYRCFLVPALVAALLQIFAMSAAIRAMGREVKRGTVGRWWRHAGRSTGAALFGKLLPYAVVHSLVSLLLLLLWHGPMGNPLAGSLLLEWAALSGMGWTAEAVAVFMVGWTADYRLSLSLGAFFGGPSMAFAGVTFPAAAMNGPSLGWASLLPLTHAIRVVVDQGLRGSSFRADAGAFAALAFLSLFFVGSTWRRWGRLWTDPSEWRQS